MNKLKLGLVSLGSAIATFAVGLVAHAQVVPSVGTTDIAAVGGPLLSSLIVGGEYLMITFGPPLLYFGLAVLIFWVIRTYVSRKRPHVM